MNVQDTSLFGGKIYPDWQEEDFCLPGYKNAKIILQNNENNSIYKWGFMASPSSINMQFANDIQKSKTMAGWIMTHEGPSLAVLALSGVFLDTLKSPERLRFWWYLYNPYIQDQQDRYMEFANNWKQTIRVEGLFFDGVIESMTQSKNAQSPFLYQYNISFSFYNVRSAYSTIASNSMSVEEMKKYMGVYDSKTTATPIDSSKKIEISNGVLSILNR